MTFVRAYIALFVVAISMPIASFAQSVIADLGDFTFECSTHGRNTATLLAYRGNQAVLDLPATISFNDASYTLTRIGNDFAQPFYDNSTLTRIILPKTVTAIAPEAFHGCTMLTKVKLGSVTEIGDYAFAYCTRLNQITLPVTLQCIGYGAFAHCSQLTSIVLPERVNTLIGATFEHTPLTDLQILAHTPPEVAFDLDPQGKFYSQCSLFVPLGSADCYNTLPWSRFSSIAERPQNGDINADASIDVADLNILSNIILGKDDADRYDGRASVAHAATIDVNDVNMLINILIGDY